MKSLIYRSTTPRIAIIIASILFVVLTVFFVVSRVGAQAPGDASSGRLVTVHDRGVQTSVLTDAVTVGDALRQAGVTLNESDAVEPAADTKLVASQYDINVYRARPVIVIDSNTKQKVITPYQTGEQIAKSAGITLYDEDTTLLTRNEDIVSDGAGLRLTVDRAVPFTFNLYGTTALARTQGGTVGEMLKEKGVTLGASDRVSPDVSTVLAEGLAVRVWREGKQTIAVDEAISYSIEQIQDGDQYVGYSAVKTSGQPGARSVTYEIIVQDGAEVGRTEIASITTKKPIAQIEIVGAKIRTVPYTGGGSKTEWLTAAGIPQADWGYAESIVQRESSWNPNAVNASSGACGLAQALPCSKVPGNPLNPIDSLRWQYGYVTARYGGYAGAYAFWQINRWY
jgi:uncharacterized protein YabE (DUF348 family)